MAVAALKQSFSGSCNSSTAAHTLVLQDMVAKVQDLNEELMTVGREMVDLHGEMVLLLNYSALNYTVDSGKRRSKVVDFEALSRHGYKGGLSIFGVPPPKEVDQKQDWSWSTGKKSRAAQETEETFEERQRTRAAITEGEQLTHVLTQKEKKNLSFAQKEKRKRDMGQASRGKNYVEEEKRMLRESGVYSGFDS